MSAVRDLLEQAAAAHDAELQQKRPAATDAWLIAFGNHLAEAGWVVWGGESGPFCAAAEEDNEDLRLLREAAAAADKELVSL